MSAYIKQLQAEAKRAAAARAAAEIACAAQVEAKRQADALDVRLASLLATIPAAELAQGLSLPVLQKALQGDRPRIVHAGSLGICLSRAGFARRRAWGSRTGSFPALWFRAAAA